MRTNVRWMRKKGGSAQQLTYTQNDLCLVHYSFRIFCFFAILFRFFFG